ncbi:MAG: M24 family metallopeptidase [bacterium]|nr:M24 family metallopeptidase [bacterium]
MGPGEAVDRWGHRTRCGSPHAGRRAKQAWEDINALAIQGVREPAFVPIIAAGRNAVSFHYNEAAGTVRDGDLVLTDVGAHWNNYPCDITRTFPANGRFTAQQKEIYSMALKINKEMMSMIVPGKTTVDELIEHYRRRGPEELLEAGYISSPEEGKFCIGNTGNHRIGLDIHEVAKHRRVIEPNMVTTIEPGIYLEDLGVGVRIEDNILITEDGYEVLSKDIIREIDDIEAMMN